MDSSSNSSGAKPVGFQKEEMHKASPMPIWGVQDAQLWLWVNHNDDRDMKDCT
jgi:hypothetical protein